MIADKDIQALVDQAAKQISATQAGTAAVAQRAKAFESTASLLLETLAHASTLLEELGDEEEIVGVDDDPRITRIADGITCMVREFTMHENYGVLKQLVQRLWRDRVRYMRLHRNTDITIGNTVLAVPTAVAGQVIATASVAGRVNDGDGVQAEEVHGRTMDDRNHGVAPVDRVQVEEAEGGQGVPVFPTEFTSEDVPLMETDGDDDSNGILDDDCLID
jgi:hypothetical protein